MPRFRLSPSLMDVDASDTDDDSSSVLPEADELVYSEDDGDDSAEEEPPHPIGFESWGRTRFALNPVPEHTMGRFKASKGYLDPFDDALLDDWETDQPREQQFPPIISYLNPNTVSTGALIRYQTNESSKRASACKYEEDDEVDRMVHLFQAAAVIDDRALQPIRDSQAAKQSMQLPLLSNDTSNIQREMDIERRRMEREHLEAAQGLKMLLDGVEEDAEKIRAEERRLGAAEQKKVDDQQRKDEEEKKAVLEEEAVEQDKAQKAQEQRDQKQREVTAKADAAKAAAAKEREYVVKAQKLVAQLVQVRLSVEPFEKSKTVGKRRLGMKKIINGKVNTLAENAGKIQEVAAEVSQAITAARAEDEQIKQQIQAGNQQLVPAMARGKRYLVDLLSCSAMKRVQAEGFNGPRGDGFPLANMLALVSVENKDLAPVFAAHIYTVCPTAIPSLPTPAKDATEDELMESLGMLKGKNGEFETFERFLARTEGVISIVSNIMASAPESHVLLDGHVGAVNWLSRFLSLLPPAPQTPLPLLTAPVLDAFLVGAGHMLANKHADQFKIHLDTIMNDIIKRLDEGPIGRPSATRLRKFVEGGFESFKTKLPSRALSDLYIGAAGGGGGGGGQPRGSSNPFGASSGGVVQRPFSGGQTSQQNAVPNPFGASSSAPSSGASPFGGAAAAPAPSPFGGGGAVPSAPAPSPFGGGMTPAPAPSPFGAPASSSSPFGGATAPAPAPFGNASSSSPFGAPSGPASSQFGNPAPTPSPFGAQAPSPSPFGSSPAQAFGAAPAPSPFGGAAAPSPSPFGGAAAPAPSPFGGAAAPSPSPFGGAAAPSPSPFGGTAAPSPSPFGSSNNAGSGYGQQASGFGGGGGGGGNTGGGKKRPCKFFAEGRCRFGDQCTFSHDIAPQGGGGFGASNNAYGNSNPFGGARR